MHKLAAVVLGLERPDSVFSIEVDQDFVRGVNTVVVKMFASDEDCERLCLVFNPPPKHDIWTYRTPEGVGLPTETHSANAPDTTSSRER